MSCSGVGWWLSLVDLLASEYGWRMADVLATPLPQALLLREAMAQRNGVKGGITLLERQLMINLQS